ncbi:hypothetical protein [Geotoga petraea]|uniref:Tetratricopeptide repeat protein n=1 Tax=Geotoga petraea TaxID=28234 RepID=A0A1G6QER2_9BACT|nr:hypothetical protein [Geotoga petraea]MDK2945861.1 hypothetical protein [Geotoga sp.]SDC90960.1 hypothetical protein SAMN04488588_2062 [Geotoga petraea]
MKKILFLIFSLLFVLSFSNDFLEFFEETNLKKLKVSENPNSKTLGGFLLYWHNIDDDYTVYAGTNEDIIAFLKYDDNELSLINKLRYFEEIETNSIYEYGLELYFLDSYWSRTRDVHVVDRIFELRNIINNYYGKDLPRTELAVSNILWKSNIYGDKELAYEIMREQFEKYPNNSIIINTFSEMSFELKKTEYVEELYANYNLKDDYNENTLLYFIYAFLEKEQPEKARGTSKNLLNRSTNNFNKAKVYELLGDYSDNLEEKSEYYRLSLKNRYSNGEVLGKLGLTLYEMDQDIYAEQARAFLNASVAYGYSNDEINEVLSKLRWRVILNNFLIFMLPLIIITAIGIYLIVKWERWKRDDDLGRHILDNN